MNDTSLNKYYKYQRAMIKANMCYQKALNKEK